MEISEMSRQLTEFRRHSLEAVYLEQGKPETQLSRTIFEGVGEQFCGALNLSFLKVLARRIDDRIGIVHRNGFVGDFRIAHLNVTPAALLVVAAFVQHKGKVDLSCGAHV